MKPWWEKSSWALVWHVHCYEMLGMLAYMIVMAFGIFYGPWWMAIAAYLAHPAHWFNYRPAWGA